MRSTRDFRFKAKTTSGSGTFSGMLAVYNTVDLGNDVIEPGAFAKTLRGGGDNVPLLWQHDPAKPIGSLKLSDSAQGLQADGQLVMTVPEAQTAYSLLKAGVLKGLSIGYDVIQDAIDESGIRHLKELRLWEGSIVTFPMNLGAVVSSVKSLDDARRILSEAASRPEDIESVRGLLKDIQQLLPVDENEACDCGASDEDDCACVEDAEDEKQAAHILRKLVLELKSQMPRVGLLP